MKALYLSGGLRSGWQDKVLETLRDSYIYFDPRSHGYRDATLYTAWNFRAIAASDVILVYMEMDNPGGWNTAAELGFAAACGKHILYVDERSVMDTCYSKYSGMLKAASAVVYTSLDEALNYLLGGS